MLEPTTREAQRETMLCAALFLCTTFVALVLNKFSPSVLQKYRNGRGSVKSRSSTEFHLFSGKPVFGNTELLPLQSVFAARREENNGSGPAFPKTGSTERLFTVPLLLRSVFAARGERKTEVVPYYQKPVLRKTFTQPLPLRSAFAARRGRKTTEAVPYSQKPFLRSYFSWNPFRCGPFMQHGERGK